jgi:transketolase
MALRYLVNGTRANGVLRLIIGPSPRSIELPDGYSMIPGQGVTLTRGSHAALFAYGPVMVHEALLAAEILERKGISIKVINMPWLNRIHGQWLESVVDGCPRVYVMDDHSPVYGLGDMLLNKLVELRLIDERQFRKLGVKGFPACGRPDEVLQFHGLDGDSIAKRILQDG